MSFLENKKIFLKNNHNKVVTNQKKMLLLKMSKISVLNTLYGYKFVI